MKLRLIGSYPDAPYFSGSCRDYIYEIELDEKFVISYQRCEDKHSRHLGEGRLLQLKFKKETYYGDKAINFLIENEYNQEKLEDQISEFLDTNSY